MMNWTGRLESSSSSGYAKDMEAWKNQVEPCAVGSQKASVPMFRVFVSALDSLRNAFSRTATFNWFSTVVFSFLLGTENNGLQSMTNSLGIGGGSYKSMDDFFRSDAVALPSLRSFWLKHLLSSIHPMKLHGRSMLIADGVKAPKEGRKMPGVTRLHNNSETQSKPSSYHGVQGGAIGLLAYGGPAVPKEVYCIPLSMEFMYGLAPIASWEETPHPDAGESIEIQMLNRQKEYIKEIGPCILVQDRASMNQNLFEELEKMRGEKTDVYMLTNARRNVTAYSLPGEYQGVGRPRKRGEPIHMKEYFDTKKSEFKRSRKWLYGKRQKFRYYSEVMLWGDKWNGKLLFVLAELEDGRRIILATDDLSMDPCEAVALYARRFLCEEGFKVYKRELNGMGFHFWTSYMEHLSHYRKGDEPHILELADTAEKKQHILKTIKASEVYMQCACIAQGIAQLISMHQPIGGIVKQFTPKRTATRRKVSEKDVCNYMRAHEAVLFAKYSEHPLIKFILERRTASVSVLAII